MSENFEQEETVEDKEIALLNRANELASQQPDENVQAVKIVSPSDKLNEAYFNYAKHNFEEISKRDEDFTKYLQDEIKEARKNGELNANQLMTIYLNQQTSNNDRYSRMVQPFAQMALEKERIKATEESMRAATGGGGATNYGEMNKEMPKEVLQGLSIFTQIMSQINVQNVDKKVVDSPKNNN